MSPPKGYSIFCTNTKSKAKDQIEQTKTENGINIPAIGPGQRQTSEKKVLDKEKKLVRPIVPTSVRMTRSAAQATTQIVRTVSTLQESQSQEPLMIVNLKERHQIKQDL